MGDRVPLLSVTALPNCAAVCVDDLRAERTGPGHCSSQEPQDPFTPLHAASQNHVRLAAGDGTLKDRQALDGPRARLCIFLTSLVRWRFSAQRGPRGSPLALPQMRSGVYVMAGESQNICALLLSASSASFYLLGC